MLQSNSIRKVLGSYVTVAVFSALIAFAFAMPTTSFAQPASAPVTGTPITSSPAPVTGTPVTSAGEPPALNTEDSVGLVNPLKFKSLPDLLNAVLVAAIKLGTILLTLALIYTGFLFVSARGNEEKISKARTTLMYTIIGGLIILGATAISTVIQSTVTALTPS
ncbi:MAG: hypothetical protein JWL75_340 [Parcubacteria group bacterium]|nr:hypothetical protein [Parcubacteria group bacterium]